MLPFTLLAFICSFATNSHSMYVCRNTCNDGGCEYANGGGTSKGCYCPIPGGSRTGNDCESYGDACENKIVTRPPCKNGGKCVSSLGFPHCDCPVHYFGTECDGYDSGKYSPPTRVDYT